jgi:hypothetical protein
MLKQPAMSDAYDLMEDASSGLGWLGRGTSIAPDVFGHEEEFGKAGKVVNAAHGGIDLGMGAYDLYKDPHSDEGYEKIGGGALHTAGAILGDSPEGKMLEGGEMAVDLVGSAAGKLFGEKAGFNADQVAGGMIRHTFGDESSGWAAGSAVSDALGGGALGTTAGVLAGSVVEGAAMPIDIARAGLDGIGHEASAIWDGVGDQKMTMDPSSGEKFAQQLRDMQNKKKADKAVSDVQSIIAVNNAIIQANMIKFQTDKMLQDAQAKAHPAAAPKAAHPKHHHRKHHRG